MTFPRIRTPGQWIDNSVVEDTELETIDENLSNALDGADGGAYAPSAPLVIGGAGMHFTGPLQALGLSDIPMRGALPAIDTGELADNSTVSRSLVWCPFADHPQWILLHNGVALHSLDEEQILSTVPAVTPDVDWNDAAANATRVVALGTTPNTAAADFPTSMTWAACTGGIASGDWRAIVWDGSRFIAGNAAGQFSFSAVGESWAVAINGNPNWLGGPNEAAQLAVGKGPSLQDRVYAVADAGTTNWFAWSDDSGSTWGEVNAGAALTWKGIAYRATDHTWLAIASEGNVYRSTDGGATWSEVADLSSSGFAPDKRLWLLNDYFVTMSLAPGLERRLIYSRDGITWHRGKYASRFNAYGADQVAIGNGGLAWAQMKVSQNIFLRFSQKSSLTPDTI